MNMKYGINLLLAVALITFVTIGCKKKQRGNGIIPKNAIVAGALDVNSLEKKLLTDSLTFDMLIKGFSSNDNDSTMKKAFEKYTKFKTSGIKSDAKIYFFTYTSKNGGQQLMGATIAVTDRKKLETFIKDEWNKENTPLTETKKGDYTVLSTEKDKNYVLGLSDNNILVLGKTNSYSNSEVSLQDEIARLFDLKPAEALAGNTHFDELDNEKADGFFFTSNTENADQLKQLKGFGKIDELVKDLNTGGTFNFEKGKVVFQTKTWANDKLGKLLSKHAGNTINVSTIEKFPVKSLNGFISINFKPELFIDLLKEAELYNEAVGIAKTQKRSTLDLDPLLLYKAFGGEVNVIAGDFDPAKGEAAQGTMGGIPAVNAMLELKVGNKAAFTEIMDSLIKRQMVKNDAGVYKFIPAEFEEFPVRVSITDQRILIATNKDLLTTYNTGNTNLPADVKSKAASSSAMAYLDINNVKPLLQSLYGIKENALISVLKASVFSMGNYKDGVLQGQFELQTTNENQNALPVLVKAAIAQKQEADINRVKNIEKIQQLQPMTPVVPKGQVVPPVERK